MRDDSYRKALVEICAVMGSRPEGTPLDGYGAWAMDVAHAALHGLPLPVAPHVPTLCPNCKAPLGLLGCDGCEKDLCACCVVAHECEEEL